MKKTKKELLLEAIKIENWKDSLLIAKSFKRDFNKEEQMIIQHAYAYITGQSISFFEQLHIDLQTEYNKALDILKNFSSKHDKIQPFYINEKQWAEKLRKKYFGNNSDDIKE